MIMRRRRQQFTKMFVYQEPKSAKMLPGAVHHGPVLQHKCARGGRAGPASRVQARSRLAGLAQRIEPAAAWDDLVLPAAETTLLRPIAAQVAQRATVYESPVFKVSDETNQCPGSDADLGDPVYDSDTDQNANVQEGPIPAGQVRQQLMAVTVGPFPSGSYRFTVTVNADQGGVE